HSRPPCGSRELRICGVSASLIPCGAAPFGPRLRCASPAVLILGLLAETAGCVSAAFRPPSFRAAPRPSGLGSAARRPPYSFDRLPRVVAILWAGKSVLPAVDKLLD